MVADTEKEMEALVEDTSMEEGVEAPQVSRSGNYGRKVGAALLLFCVLGGVCVYNLSTKPNQQLTSDYVWKKLRHQGRIRHRVSRFIQMYKLNGGGRGLLQHPPHHPPHGPHHPPHGADSVDGAMHEIGEIGAEMGAGEEFEDIGNGLDNGEELSVGPLKEIHDLGMSEDQVYEHTQEFQAIDNDPADGQITLGELHAMIIATMPEDVPPPPEEFFEEMFHEAHPEREAPVNSVSLKEFLNMMVAVEDEYPNDEPSIGDQAEELLHMIDTDHDGVASHDEIVAFLRMVAPPDVPVEAFEQLATEMLQMFDYSQDGELDSDEVEAMLLMTCESDPDEPPPCDEAPPSCATECSQWAYCMTEPDEMCETAPESCYPCAPFFHCDAAQLG